MRTKRKSTPMILFAVAIVLSGCKSSVSESDAIFYGYCTGIYPHAEVAIQRGYLRYPRGTFQRVADRASRSFPAPVTWDADNANIFRREMGRGQNHGGAISRGDVQSSDITRLDACVEWAAAL